MRTLKQIREQAESKIICEDLLSENPIARRDNSKEKAPSISKLPLILIFRRRSYRYYPDKQIVGLYYNNLTDKYLSVPMGPTPNLNMSEESLDEGLPLAALARGAMSMGGKALGWAANKLSNKTPNNQATNSVGNDTATNIKYGGSGGPKKFQSKSSLSYKAKSSDAIKQAKLDQAALTPLKENRIHLMRDMIKENRDSIDFHFGEVSLPVSRTVSKRILEVYDGLNRTNKKQVEKMLNESVGSFKKLVAFSIKKQEG
jgi:hypothetical protein